MPVTVADERESELNRMTPVGSSYLTPEYSSADARLPSLSLIIPQKLSWILKMYSSTKTRGSYIMNTFSLRDTAQTV